MEAETSRRKSTRWVEFMAEGSIAKQQNSKKHVEEERVEYAQCKAGTEEEQVEGPRSSLTNFERLANQVTSNQSSLGKCLQLSSLNKPENHSSYKNQNPLNESLVPTTFNTLTSMETEITDVINSSVPNQNQPNISSQDTLWESQQPLTLKSNVASNYTSPQLHLNQPSGPIPNLVSNDPTLLIGLSKAQNNSLSWSAYYNERELSSKIQVSPPSNEKEQKPSTKRKLLEDEGLANNRAIKLTKVGSGLIKVAHQSINYIEGAHQKTFKRNVPTRRKKMKDLARELPCLQAQSDPDEVNSDPSSISHIVSTLISKMAEEAGLNMPPPQP